MSNEWSAIVMSSCPGILLPVFISSLLPGCSPSPHHTPWHLLSSPFRSSGHPQNTLPPLPPRPWPLSPGLVSARLARVLAGWPLRSPSPPVPSVCCLLSSHQLFHPITPSHPLLPLWLVPDPSLAQRGYTEGTCRRARKLSHEASLSALCVPSF